MKRGITSITIALMIFGLALLNSCQQKKLCPAYVINEETIEINEVDA